ncbi:transmembrane protein 272-like [Astyanax mexicanus]|uniref:Transmembrane protein 272-like n=1 Tax=Astyanax mexicanus TaxID=7994 RepID=A0A8T2MJ48_ASTMX|nr:transmembrane protein 272-like [Astyanax mexicanus]
MMEDRTLLQNLRRTPKPSTPVLIISKLLAIALPITQLIIGGLYLHDCPAQPYISIYLLVSGGFAVVLGVLSCLPCTQEQEDGTQTPFSSLCTAWNSLVTLFLFCWFIAGNVWIYSIYQPSYDPGSGKLYCAKVLYLFAFWSTTLVYILLGLLMLGGCCALFFMCVFGRSGLSDSDRV